MAEPIILDGGAQMVTIKLPTSFKIDAQDRGKFSPTAEPERTPFERIVVTNQESGEEMLNWPLDGQTLWKIEIK
jgi:hypothetical protein